MTELGNNTQSDGPKESFDYRAYTVKHRGVTLTKYRAGEIIYAQGDPADAVFYIVNGTVKISVLSDRGKEGIIALLGPGDFFGEGCLDRRRYRASTITATSACEIVRFSRDAIRRALAEDTAFSQLFFRWLLGRNEKLKADLLDQLFYSSEKRLARILLTLASTGADAEPRVISIPVTQDTLAQMVGTTRARINQFMTKFRKLGHIDYDGTIRVRNSLLNIILEEPRNEGNELSPRR